MSDFKIICVTDRKSCAADFFERLSDVSRCVDAVILREKDFDEAQYAELARRAHKICKEKLVLHGAPALALLPVVPRIHLPLEIFENNLKLRREAQLVGVSVHSKDEARRAEELGADCVVAGHIYATGCKPNLAPRGVVFLREVVCAVRVPVYAIGGIRAQNIAEVLKAGASGACLMSGLMQCRDAPGEIAALKEALCKQMI